MVVLDVEQLFSFGAPRMRIIINDRVNPTEMHEYISVRVVAIKPANTTME